MSRLTKFSDSFVGNRMLATIIVVGTLIALAIALAFGAPYLTWGFVALKTTLNTAVVSLAGNTTFAELAVHALFLIIVLSWGWFGALRVGNAVSFPIKVGVLAATAGVYVLSSSVWVPMIISAASRLAL